MSSGILALTRELRDMSRYKDQRSHVERSTTTPKPVLQDHPEQPTRTRMDPTLADAVDHPEQPTWTRIDPALADAVYERLLRNINKQMPNPQIVRG